MHKTSDYEISWRTCLPCWSRVVLEIREHNDSFNFSICYCQYSSALAVPGWPDIIIHLIVSRRFYLLNSALPHFLVLWYFHSPNHLITATRECLFKWYSLVVFKNLSFLFKLNFFTFFISNVKIKKNYFYVF
jgi:hypothetical protein